MFWGLIMEPQRRYTQKVKKSFQITMAALDISTSDGEPAQVMCSYEGRNYLLCTLRKPDILQCPLDLMFDVGNEVAFATNGKSHIHLTGVLREDLDVEDESDDDEETDEEVEVETDENIVQSKRTKTKSQVNGPPKKKPKLLEHVSSESDEDSDSDEEDNEDEEAEDEENVNEEEEDDEILSMSEEDSEEEKQQKEKVNAKQSTNLNGVEQKGKQESNKKAKVKPEKTKSEPAKKHIPKKQVLERGVMVEDLKEGNGPKAKSGKFVTVYYEGRLKHNNKLFDSSNTGSGFKFRLGAGEVIKGWDIALVGMQVGGKRRITCPPNVAYGTKGSPPAIPPNSTLVFDVELKRVYQ